MTLVTGWTYAVDFPATYSTKKQWNSCVRRRKWVRYRRYSAMNSWCAIAPLHKDPTKEPFIDVAIGGHQIPGGNPGSFAVWAVTAHGRVMFRVGVSSTTPEGQRWSAIKFSGTHEVSRVSVGVTGLVWVILANGKTAIRTGVTRDNLMGEDWCELEPPEKDLRLTHISIGLDSVWAVTSNGSVWFRKGIKGEMSGMCKQLATGTGWVQMLSKMALVSVASNDHVWAIGYEDRCLYYRTGISRSELTGKKWRLINVPLQSSRTSSNISVSSRNSHSIRETAQKLHQSWSSLNRLQCSGDNSTIVRDWEEQSRSAPTPTTALKLWQKNDVMKDEVVRSTLFREMYNTDETNQSDNSINSNNSLDLINSSAANIKISNESLSHSGESTVISGKGMTGTIKVNPAAWSPVHSVGSMVGIEAHPETDNSIFDPDLTGDSGVCGEDESSTTMYWAESNVLWCKVEAGACIIDPANPPKWTVFGHSMNYEEISESWRIHILEALRSRMNSLNFDTSKWEKAIDRSSWIKHGDARYKLKGSNTYEDCAVELEWISSDNSTLDTGMLTVLNVDGITTLIQFSVSEIACVVCCSEPASPKLAIHTPTFSKSKVLRLQFSTDTEMEDWMTHITSVTCKMNSINSYPSSNSIWATTALGDIFVYDPIISGVKQYVEGIYTQELDVADGTLPFESILYNGFGLGHSLDISASIHDDADRLTFNFVCHMAARVHQKDLIDTHDIAFHFNPRLKDNLIVRNTFQSGQWGDEERGGISLLKPGSSFTLKIICEMGGFRIFIHDKEFTFYCHRVPPQNITHLKIKGLMTLHKVLYKSPSVIMEPTKMFWRQIGGHLKKVETCTAGITWGIGYDNTAWVYTGGYDGTFFKRLGSNNTEMNIMTDTHNYVVYENQRWNPVTGYTSHGLPTDRYMWSDITGRHKRTREHTKLLSMHWRWISDWIIDFHTPGGVDCDGWQYATDFSSQYHGKKHFTDYVRRRRWFRRCLLTCSGPWKELGNTKIVDVSLHVTEDHTADTPIRVWAVAANGEALFRRGVSESCPMGVSWEHIPSDQPLSGISCGPMGQVWAVGRNGSSYWRFGISHTKSLGEMWTNVEPPAGTQLKQISVGKNVVWALDTTGKLSLRREIQPKVFPEGTFWQTLPAMPNDPIHIDLSVITAKQGFRHVSVSHETGQVWAISGAGIVCQRIGVTNENPAGTGWTTGIGANWQHISLGGLARSGK
ncbi:hypothetical protein PV327_010141 [Microctonus hyperodae]|uniref:Galectin domain-containing protein n=1 Tax=Microctonus hyperodae TaxID=165561 RepID=A0AA39FS47_MICHY|nr:hypothetical protein PV327_010141 [Microctonus hyperodae]